MRPWLVPTVLLFLASNLGACSLVRGAPLEGASSPDPRPSATTRGAGNGADPASSEREASSRSSRSEDGERDVARTYEIAGSTYDVWADGDGYVERGIASWYGEELEGRPTASGEPFDPYGMTAAHRSLPLGSFVEVENLENGRTVIVRINDRGPFVEGRVIDLALAAAQALGFAGQGTTQVEVRSVE